MEVKCIESMLLILKLSFTKYVYNSQIKDLEKFSRTDRQTDRPTEGQTDKPSYRSSSPELKKCDTVATSELKNEVPSVQVWMDQIPLILLHT